MKLAIIINPGKLSFQHIESTHMHNQSQTVFKLDFLCNPLLVIKIVCCKQSFVLSYIYLAAFDDDLVSGV